jgi:hypothetical protein
MAQDTGLNEQPLPPSGDLEADFLPPEVEGVAVVALTGVDPQSSTKEPWEG